MEKMNPNFFTFQGFGFYYQCSLSHERSQLIILSHELFFLNGYKLGNC